MLNKHLRISRKCSRVVDLEGVKGPGYRFAYPVLLKICNYPDVEIFVCSAFVSWCFKDFYIYFLKKKKTDIAS